MADDQTAPAITGLTWTDALEQSLTLVLSHLTQAEQLVAAVQFAGGEADFGPEGMAALDVTDKKIRSVSSWVRLARRHLMDNRSED